MSREPLACRGLASTGVLRLLRDCAANPTGRCVLPVVAPGAVPGRRLHGLQGVKWAAEQGSTLTPGSSVL